MLAVRVLAFGCFALLIVTVLEARTIRHARSELQQLRNERDRTKAAIASAWTREPIDEFDHAVRWLDGFYSDSFEGFARPGGLCAGGRLDDRAIAEFVAGRYLEARAAGKSYDAGIDARGARKSEA